MNSTEKPEGQKEKALTPKENIIGVTPSGMLIKESAEPLKPRCKVCGRVLKGRNAIKRGMGKTCERKQAARQILDIDEHSVWRELLIAIGVWFSDEAGRELGIPDSSNYISEYKLTKR